MDQLFFRSFGSGSSGNCYLLGNNSSALLIDAGVGVRTIRRLLKTMSLDFCNIWGVLVTHDHADHIRAVGSIGEKHHVPVYTTKKIHDGINRNYVVTQKLSTSQRVIEIGEEFVIGDFSINTFPVSHDATESVGYTINYKGKVISIATDLGFISDETAAVLQASDSIILEANYDPQMLRQGTYPEYLKQRIASETGHLSNEQAAGFLAENYNGQWKYVFLCHLSKDNNHPDTVLKTINERLEQELKGDVNGTEIIPLPRTEPSALYFL